MGARVAVSLVYTLDTNAVLYFLKADVHAGPFLRDLITSNETLYVSTVTEIELFSFPRLTPEEMHDITELLARLSAILLDSRLARMAGDIRRLYHLQLPDSAIAATALFTGSNLLTRNIRDFKKVPELRLRAV